MSLMGMEIKVHKEKLDGVTCVDLQFCEDCVLGIQKKVGFSNGG